MTRRRHTPEQINRKRREADRMLGGDAPTPPRPLPAAGLCDRRPVPINPALAELTDGDPDVARVRRHVPSLACR